jgi:hypothetical protein
VWGKGWWWWWWKYYYKDNFCLFAFQTLADFITMARNNGMSCGVIYTITTFFSCQTNGSFLGWAFFTLFIYFILYITDCLVISPVLLCGPMSVTINDINTEYFYSSIIMAIPMWDSALLLNKITPAAIRLHLPQVQQGLPLASWPAQPFSAVQIESLYCPSSIPPHSWLSYTIISRDGRMPTTTELTRYKSKGSKN